MTDKKIQLNSILSAFLNIKINAYLLSTLSLLISQTRHFFIGPLLLSVGRCVVTAKFKMLKSDCTDVTDRSDVT
jgi:hypothetical protein